MMMIHESMAREGGSSLWEHNKNFNCSYSEDGALSYTDDENEAQQMSPKELWSTGSKIS